MASSHRERLLPAQGLPQDRNSLRQAGKKLSRFRLPHSRYHMVELMSLGPKIEKIAPYINNRLSNDGLKYFGPLYRSKSLANKK